MRTGSKWLRRAGVWALAVWLAFAALVPSAGWAATPVSQVFDIEAPSGLLMDAETGQVLWEKEADQQRQPASIVKVMTLLLAMEAVESGVASLQDRVRISRRAQDMGGSQVYLAEGEVYTLESLLKALAIASGNDAAVAVAEHIAGSEEAFVALMNSRARELGMTRTTFVNSHGLPEAGEGAQDGLSTARDIALMSRELIRRYPKVLEWTSTYTETLTGQGRPQPFQMVNTNRLIRVYEGADGLKTGHFTEAGWSLVGTARRENTRLISVVLGTPGDEARISQTVRLLDFGFRGFRPVVAAARGEEIDRVKLRNGSPEMVPVEAAQELRVLALAGDTRRVERRLDLNQGLSAPLEKGARVGQVVALVEGRPVASVPAITTVEVRKANFLVVFFRWLRDLILSPFRR